MADERYAQRFTERSSIDRSARWLMTSCKWFVGFRVCGRVWSVDVCNLGGPVGRAWLCAESYTGPVSVEGEWVWHVVGYWGAVGAVERFRTWWVSLLGISSPLGIAYHNE